MRSKTLVLHSWSFFILHRFTVVKILITAERFTSIVNLFLSVFKFIDKMKYDDYNIKQFSPLNSCLS